MRLIALSGNAAAAIGEVAAALVGAPITRLFHFIEAESGALPILEALTERRRFDDQLAFVRGAPNLRYRLAGVPVLDDAGTFLGFRGTAAVATKPLRRWHLPQRCRTTRRGSATGWSARCASRSIASSPGRSGSVPRTRAHSKANMPVMPATSQPPHAISWRWSTTSSTCRRSSQDFEPAVEDIDLVEMAAAAAGLLGVRAISRKVTIERPEAGETAPARGDYRRVLQILVNLIGNALRYAPEKTAVVLTVDKGHGRTALTVADRGKGVLDEDQHRIFERFERVDPGEAGGMASRPVYRPPASTGDEQRHITVASVPGDGARHPEPAFDLVWRLPTGT